MFKKIVFSFLFIIPVISMADTTTSRMGLTKPSVGSANWGVKLNTDMDTIDSNVAILGSTNTFSSDNIFRGTNTFNGGNTYTSWETHNGTQTINSTMTITGRIVGIRSEISTVTYVGSSIAGTLLDNSTQTANGGHRYNSWAQFSGTTSIKGVIDGSSAPSGVYGEIVSTSSSGYTAFPASGSYGDIVSITLSAGTWLLWTFEDMNANGGTITDHQSGLGTATGNNSAGLTFGSTVAQAPFPLGGANVSTSLPAIVKASASQTTYYLKSYANYSVATPRAYGRITALRIY